MKEPIRERNVDINPERTKVKARKYEGRIEFYGEVGSYSGYDKLRWEAWKFTDVDASFRDGALGIIEAGGRTPVEFITADKIFSLVFIYSFLSLNFLFIPLDNFSTDFF